MCAASASAVVGLAEKFGMTSCDTEVDGSLYLLCCRSRSYRYSLFGGNPGGDDRWPKKEDKRDLMK